MFRHEFYSIGIDFLGMLAGSTLISFLVVLKITKLGMIMVALGHFLHVASKSDKTRHVRNVLVPAYIYLCIHQLPHYV